MISEPLLHQQRIAVKLHIVPEGKNNASSLLNITLSLICNSLTTLSSSSYLSFLLSGDGGFCESAGAWAVGFNLFMETSWPYFTNAILESGGPTGSSNFFYVFLIVRFEYDILEQFKKSFFANC